MAETQAVSSPAEEIDPFHGETPTLREFNEFRVTGEVPARFKPAEKAESASADAPEQTAESEHPESDPGETQEPPKGSAAEKRIKQLLAQNKDLERRLAAQAKPDETPASSAEPAQATTPRPKPKIDDKKPDGTPKYANYEEFVEELADWKADQRIERVRQQDAQQAQVQKVRDNIEEAQKRYGDEFDEVIEPAAGAINGNKDIPLEVKRMLSQSDVLPELLYTVGTDQKTMDELARLAKVNPIQAMRYIATLEVGIRQELAASESEEEPEEEVPAPEPKKTSAPKPPAPVTGGSSRAFDVSDESLSAEDWMRKRNAQLERRRRI